VLALAVCAFTAAGHDSPSAIADWAAGCSQETLAVLGGRRDPWTGQVRPRASARSVASSPVDMKSPRFADKAPRQVWALLIDEGTYLASVSTMYRLLREAGQVRERRAQAAHPARTRPELIATGPNQVWSWDITKLAGPQRGVLLPPVRHD
jgi:hypothetical protein